MTRIAWGKGPRIYTTGVDRGVLYTPNGAVAWTGLVSVADKVADNKSSVYLDGQRIRNEGATENYDVTLSAFTYPEEFTPYDGFDDVIDVQTVPRFDLSFRVKNGDDYRIHIIYNAIAIPSDKTWSTNSDSPAASLFSWDISTIPEEYAGIKPTAHLIIDTSAANSEVISAVEDWLYGTDALDPSMPTIEELVALFEAHAQLVIVDHGDGTWTATGPSDMVQDNGDGTYTITSPTAIFINSTTYTLSSA